jgi:Immunoglobulin I-set domain
MSISPNMFLRHYENISRLFTCFFCHAVPPLIRDTPGDIVVTQGRSIRLPCEVSGDPRPQITWTKNGVRLSEVDPHYFISESGSLEIFSADPQDTATYSCTAINVAGVKEKRIMLFVQSKQ